MQWRALFLMGAVGLLLAACVSPTPFQPADPDGRNGYAVQGLEQNRFRLTFAGNTVTPRQQVEQNLLYLAAQVTLKGGNDYFIITTRSTDVSTTYQTFGDPWAFDGPYFGGGYGCCWYPRGLYGADTGLGTTTTSSNAYDAVAEIVTYKGRKPAGDPYAYDAHEVMDRLGTNIVRGERTGPY
jgi:hypothetical protein